MAFGQIKMDTKVRIQHYVPRVYLKNFAQERRGQHYLYCFDKLLKKSYGINISKVACDEEFYDTVKEEQITEEFLRELETEFGTIIQKIIRDNDLKSLNSKEKEVLSRFIAAQLVRTNETRIDFRDIPKQILNKWGHEMAGKLKNEVEEALEEEHIRENHRSFIIKSISLFSEIINEMKWILVVNKTSDVYLTSDNPITLFNPLPPPPFLSNLGLKSKGIQVFFPLSPLLKLIICDPEEYSLLPEKAEISDIETTIFSNDLQVLGSTRSLFSIKNDFSIAERRLKETPEAGNPDRHRLRID